MILKTNKGIEFVIDDEDYILVKDKSFYCVSNNTGQFYIRITNNKKVVGLHRYLLGVTDPKLFVDHIDGNTFNNSKSNLRICNNGQNVQRGMSNKGVYFNGYNYIAYCGKKYLGSFKTKKEAIEIKNKATLEIYGSLAKFTENK